MIRYQGETIDFNVKFDDELSMYSKIVIYAYTLKSNITKFSYPTSIGYESLEKIDNMLIGRIPSKDSSLYCEGQLIIDVLYQDDTGSLVRIAHKKTTCNILPSIIKLEVI